MENRVQSNENDGILHPIRSDRNSKNKNSAIENAKTEYKKVEIIALDNLIKFKNHPFQTYEGERLEELAESIRKNGLLQPIIVRPAGDDKFEILSGHNRVNAVNLIGQDRIDVIIREDLSDDMAELIVIQSNLNQQSFSDWPFSQQIRVIKIYNRHINKNSRQGKRTDLEKDSTCVQSEHKLDKKKKRPKTRDKIAQSLGISTTRLERYRSIAKLDDAMSAGLGDMMDGKRLGFMAAFHISQLKPGEIVSIVTYLKNNPEVNPKGINIKSLLKRSKETERNLPINEIKEILLLTESI